MLTNVTNCAVCEISQIENCLYIQEQLDKRE